MTRTLRGLFVLCFIGVHAACEGSSTEPDAAAPRLVMVAGNLQQGFQGEVLPLPVTVQARWADGKPAGGVRVRFSTDPAHGRTDVAEARTAADGTATANWRLGTARLQRLEATLPEGGASVTFQAEAHTAAEADVVEFAGAAGETITIMLLVLDAVRAVYTLPAGESVLRLPPVRAGSPTPEVVAFTPGRRPAVVAPERWSAAPDTVRVELLPPLPLPLAVYIVTGDYEERLAQARAELELFAQLLEANRTGFTLGPTEFHDATGAGAPTNMTCDAPGVSAVGRTADRINVYYIGTVGLYTGMACAPHTVLMATHGQQFTPMLLAHEIGHLLDLPHLYEAGNLMHPLTLSPQLTAGQVFRAHFSAFSAVRTVYRAVPEEDVRSCWMPPGRTRGCPPLNLRAW